MGQCTSRNISSNEVFNQSKKSDRQLRTGLKFKDIEFGGFIGYSVTINDVYTPSRPQPSEARHTGGTREALESQPQGGTSELVEQQTEITS